MSRKIRIKRGTKSKLPQLDVAELGFTTDTEQTYIGNINKNIELAKQETVDEVDSRLTQQLADKADGNVFRFQKGSGGSGASAVNIIQGFTGNDIAQNISSATISGGGAPGFENIIGGSAENVGTNSPNVANINDTIASYSVIGGGYDNVANGLASVLTGFHCVIENLATHGTICGGSYHKINNGDYGFIGGGTNNILNAGNTVICGGLNNKIDNAGSVIVGGSNNEITGNNAIIGSGNNNKAQGLASGIFSGTNNTASGLYANICGGTAHVASANYTFIGGGHTNTASNVYATVGGGFTNTASGQSSTIGGGQGNQTNGTCAAIVGGRENVVNNPYATGMGRETKSHTEGQVVHANGKFSTVGDAQRSTLLLRRQTNDATSTIIGIGGVSSSPQIPADTTWAFHYKVVARRTDADGESAYIEVKGLIQKGSTGNAALVGIPTKTMIAASASASTWDVSILAGSSSLNLNAVGEDGKNINWVAQLDLVEVTG